MPTPNLIGQQIHHYEILSHLGGGGMGVVYKAKDTKLGRTVALKFLAPQLTSDPDLKKRFVQEAKAASALDHPNIGVVHDINETQDGRLFITMAYYEGETLKDKIAQGPIPTDQAIDYASQIAKGLVKAHEANIVHRDIKPANILITSDNTVKIVDFGLAKMTGETQLTKTGSTIGTIAYMSPEQLNGGELDHRTDIWSLGVVLYEMVMGKRPFGGNYEHEIIYRVLHDEAEMGEVPEDVRFLVQKALQKEVSKRYQAATEFMGDLRPYASASEPISLKKTETSKPWHSVRKFSSFAAIVFIGAIAAVGFLSAFFPRKGSEPPTQLVEKQLTFSGQALSPAISPDGELMAYMELLTDSTGRVLIREIEGGQPTVVIPETEYNAIYPIRPNLRWSPDGKMLAVFNLSPQSVGGGELDIFSRLGQFIRTVSVSRSTYSWSPDASEIVYFARDTLFYVNINTLEEERVATSLKTDEYGEVAWSPGGTHVALSTSIVTDSTNVSVIWMLGRDGAKSQLVYESGLRLYQPIWDGEGKSLYFYQVKVAAGYSLELCSLAISPQTGQAMGDVEVLHTFPGSVYRMSFSEANSRLLYDSEPLVSNLIGYDLQDGSVGVWNALTQSTSIKLSPYISEDGDEITFLMQNVNGYDVYTMAADGSNMQQRTFSDGTMFGDVALARLIRHHDEVLVLVFSEGTTQLQEIDLATGKITTHDLSDIGAGYTSIQSGDFDWQGGDVIVYQRNPGNGQVVLAEYNIRTREVVDLMTPNSTNSIFPSYSPGSDAIAFLSVPSGRISVLNKQNGTIKEVYKASRSMDGNPFAFPVRWSSTGTHIYARSTGVIQGNSIFRFLKISVEDGAVTELGTVPASIYPLGKAISPDGRFVVTVDPKAPIDVWMLENFDPGVE